MIIYFNSIGLNSPFKTLYLVMTVEISKPNVFLVQETMDEKYDIVEILIKAIKAYNFLALVSLGNHGGNTGWRKVVRLY